MGMQPIIATLILMVAGRGIAQIITDGKQMTIMYSPFKFISQGSFLYLPMPIIITAVIILADMRCLRGKHPSACSWNRLASTAAPASYPV